MHIVDSTCATHESKNKECFVPRVLILKMGTTEPVIVEKHGDYESWFQQALEDLGCSIEVFSVFEGEGLPVALDADGVLLTGSPLSVRDELPWMKEVGQWAVEKASMGTPVLGVCFGHQLLGELLGGRVEENPRGPEWGAIEVALEEAGQGDPLFHSLPSPMWVQASHRDVLVDGASELVVLARNPNTAIQAYAWGRYLRGVQFHPELDPVVLRDLLAERSLSGKFVQSEHGRMILSNWVKHWLR